MKKLLLGRFVALSIFLFAPAFHTLCTERCSDILKTMRLGLVRSPTGVPVFEVTEFLGQPVNGQSIPNSNFSFWAQIQEPNSGTFPIIHFGAQQLDKTHPSKALTVLDAHDYFIDKEMIGTISFRWSDIRIDVMYPSAATESEYPFAIFAPAANLAASAIHSNRPNTSIEIYSFEENLTKIIFRSLQEYLRGWLEQFEQDSDNVDLFIKENFSDAELYKELVGGWRAWLKTPHSMKALHQFTNVTPQSFNRTKGGLVVSRGAAQLWITDDELLSRGPPLPEGVFLQNSSDEEALDRDELNEKYETNLILIYGILKHMTKQLSFAPKLEKILKKDPHWNSFIQLFKNFSLGAITLAEGEGWRTALLKDSLELDGPNWALLSRTASSISLSFSLRLFPPNYKPSEDDGQ